MNVVNAEVQHVFDDKIESMTCKIIRDFAKIKKERERLDREENAIKMYLKNTAKMLMTEGVRRARLTTTEGDEALVFLSESIQWDQEILEEAYAALGGHDKATLIEKVVRFKPVSDVFSTLERLIEKNPTEARTKSLKLLNEAHHYNVQTKVK